MATTSRCDDGVPSRHGSKDTIVPADKSSSKAAWRRSLSATVNHEDHPALQPCHAYSTPNADSYTSQDRSFASSSSTLSSAPPSPPTSKSFSRPSVPQQAHTTPNGYRLGPDGNEGWNSSSSSSSGHTVRSPRQSSSGASSPRTKHTIYGGVGDGVLVVPAVNEKPVKNVVVEFMGLKLCRVCDALPYLLSTRNMVDRIQAIIEDDFKHAPESTLYDLHSISAGPHHHTYTDRDRALMAILCSLRTLPFARQAQNNWYPQGLPISKDNNLVLYNHTAGLGVKQTAISLDSFVDLAQSWLYVRNPASLSGVDPSAKNSWQKIADTLSNAGVDIRKIDLQLWEALTYSLEGDDLTNAIDDVIEWSKDGTLDSRHAVWRDHAISETKMVPESLSSDGYPPTPTTPYPSTNTHTTGLYTKRFTHKHPLGRPRSLISDDEKAELRRDRAARLTAEAAAKKLAEERKEKREKREKKRGFISRVRRGWRKRKSMVWFVCFIVVILSGIMGGLVWAMASGKLDFTPGGEGV